MSWEIMKPVVKAASEGENEFVPRKGYWVRKGHVSTITYNPNPTTRKSSCQSEVNHSKVNFKLRKESPSRTEQVSISYSILHVKIGQAFNTKNVSYLPLPGKVLSGKTEQCNLPEIHISFNPEGEDVRDGSPWATPHDENSNGLDGLQSEAGGQKISYKRHEPKLAEQSHSNAPGSLDVQPQLPDLHRAPQREHEQAHHQG